MHNNNFMNIKKVIKKKIYINLLVSVISTLATSANFAIASSVDSVPPSPSSIMKIRFNATKLQNHIHIYKHDRKYGIFHILIFLLHKQDIQIQRKARLMEFLVYMKYILLLSSNHLLFVCNRNYNYLYYHQ